MRTERRLTQSGQVHTTFIGSILHGGPIEVFLVQPVLHDCLWDDAYKRTIDANRKEKPM